METALLLFRLLPAFMIVGYGTYSILEVFFPSLREPGFNQWDIEVGREDYVEVLGWRKVLKPPRVIAQGYLTDRAACALSASVGLLLITIGVLMIRHIAGLPETLPDVIDRLLS